MTFEASEDRSKELNIIAIFELSALTILCKDSDANIAAGNIKEVRRAPALGTVAIK